MLQSFDDWLISRIFEPIAWWTEYHFNLSGLKLYLYLYMLGMTALGFSMYNTGQYVFTFIDIGFVLLQIYMVPRAESRLRRNRGLNENKMYWYARLMCGALAIGVVIPHALFGTYSPNERLIDIGTIAFFLAVYFGSCNALPPGYEERKLVPRIVR